LSGRSLLPRCIVKVSGPRHQSLGIKAIDTGKRGGILFASDQMFVAFLVAVFYKLSLALGHIFWLMPGSGTKG